jgi:hypothetical protein
MAWRALSGKTVILCGAISSGVSTGASASSAVEGAGLPS